ncbi:MAG TPA: isoleucine--tRNA ligase [Rhizomicrobium sp.]|nr:isoleucine--tRNA ligase [Rhizomicrobium sp.]
MTVSKSDSAARDYRATVFLPTTTFPMKAGLPQTEPQWLARWDSMDLYSRIRAKAKGRPLFVLHDGPPYANGEIHSGTGLNKVLKDFVVRSQGMLGRDAPYVPGWDCHGLPIEWKIEERYREEGKSKDDVPIEELRRDCRQFAAHWIDIQRTQFKRLGCIGEWDKPYLTMDFRAEAVIAAELHKFVRNKLLYRGFRPVMWSPVEKTALAEAEVEYREKSSPTIYVKFPLVDGPAALRGASVVIWTTTPWTVPGNRAIAYSPDMTYGLYEVTGVKDGGLARAGELILLGDVMAGQVAANAKIDLSRKETIDPEGLVGAHPFRGKGFDFAVPLLAATHVTAETGTGFVHTAPGHGEEDFELGRAHGLKVPRTIDEEGKFYADVPLFAGKRVLTPDGKDGDANGAVIRELIAANALLAKGTLRHQYPHSWRSKAPVIFRATPQWFAAIDKPIAAFAGDTLRGRAKEAIRQTRWYPAQSENRIASMVDSRPDWVLSRQRAWGVPIAIFVNRASGDVLDDERVNARIVEAFEREGADAWFESPPQRFLGNDHDPSQFEQVKDILDVWFDSGSTYVFTVEQPIEPSWPKAERADLYLEGSDQHRGWFQSSLLESCGTRGRAPYAAVLTHGFVLDEQGHKMSKSLGNTVLPQTIADRNGADILRLWAASSDFTEDLRIGPDIIKANVDAYRRLRNTVRFMLSNLAGFGDRERCGFESMPPLERYILARLAELDEVVRAGYAAFDFNRVHTELFNFCTNELSAFYFDIRKDVLYCDAAGSLRRRAARTALEETFRRVVTWFAPMLCFTMEEAWHSRYGSSGDSVHLEDFPPTPASWSDEAAIAQWDRIRSLRRVVTGALEIARRDKVIGASLEAAPVLYLSEPGDAALFETIDLAEIAIISAATISLDAPPEDAFRLADVPGAAAQFRRAAGRKCARCWMILPEVGTVAGHDDLCRRCSAAVDALEGVPA